jgi:transposase
MTWTAAGRTAASVIFVPGGIESSQRLGRHRWVVERTFAWLARFRRLTIRYERRVDIHHAFLTLGCCLICFKQLTRFC